MDHASPHWELGGQAKYVCVPGTNKKDSFLQLELRGEAGMWQGYSSYALPEF
jgi:hypothetical protein